MPLRAFDQGMFERLRKSNFAFICESGFDLFLKLGSLGGFNSKRRPSCWVKERPGLYEMFRTEGAYYRVMETVKQINRQQQINRQSNTLRKEMRGGDWEKTAAHKLLSYFINSSAASFAP